MTPIEAAVKAGLDEFDDQQMDFDIDQVAMGPLARIIITSFLDAVFEDHKAMGRIIDAVNKGENGYEYSIIAALKQEAAR